MSAEPAQKRRKTQNNTKTSVRPESEEEFEEIASDHEQEAVAVGEKRQRGQVTSVVIQLRSRDGTPLGDAVSVPIDVKPEQLVTLVRTLKKEELRSKPEDDSFDMEAPLRFYLEEGEIATSVRLAIDVLKKKAVEDAEKRGVYLDEDDAGPSLEQRLDVVYEPQSVFRVRAVARCSSTLPGHSGAILSVHFSPDGRALATGSGDGTVRVWHAAAEMPHNTLKGHRGHVLAVAWSPDGRRLASGDKHGTVKVWCARTGKCLGTTQAHNKYVSALAWQPLHLSPLGVSDRVASASADGTVRIFRVTGGLSSRGRITLSGHKGAVRALKWGIGDNDQTNSPAGWIYSGSADRTIKCWNAHNGTCVRTLKGHAHWVGHLALSTDYVLRTGCFDHRGRVASVDTEGNLKVDPRHLAADDLTEEEIQKQCDENTVAQAMPSSEEAKAIVAAAAARVSDTLRKASGDTTSTFCAERLVSASDDNTLFLWRPALQAQPVLRMTGHQAVVNHVLFSPDSRMIASGSFDKSVRLWDGHTGKFKGVLRGHVGAVYQVAWSGDSRLCISASKDSTAKIWDVREKKLRRELPGHADEIYALDWSPDGQRVATGGKDKNLKFWRR